MTDGFQTIRFGSRFFIGKTGKGGNRAYDTGRKHAKNGGVDDQDNETYGKRSEESNDHVSETVE